MGSQWEKLRGVGISRGFFPRSLCHRAADCFPGRNVLPYPLGLHRPMRQGVPPEYPMMITPAPFTSFLIPLSHLEVISAQIAPQQNDIRDTYESKCKTTEENIGNIRCRTLDHGVVARDSVRPSCRPSTNILFTGTRTEEGVLRFLRVCPSFNVRSASSRLPRPNDR